MVWIDLETTGLAPTDHILEVGGLITDIRGDICEDFQMVVRPLPDAQMRELIELYRDAAPGTGPNIVYNMHKDSGLWDEVLESFHGDTAEVQGELVDWIRSHESEYNLNIGKMPLCGNSVWADAAWLRHSMPNVMSLFGHRIIDVSSVKELAKLRAPFIADDWQAWCDEKGIKPHRALDDIQFSVSEYRYYLDRGMIF